MKKRMLVVEDDPMLRKAMVFDFKKHGFDVEEAENGKVAYDLVCQRSFDIIMTDIRMPGGDGVELLDRIKARDPFTPVVIFITGYADLSLEDAYHKGADAIFSKPFDRNKLFHAVERSLLAREEVWAAKLQKPESKQEIKVVIRGLSEAAEGKAVLIGRGGMFVSVSSPVFARETPCEFEITCETGSPKLIHGQGLIRWSRTHATPELPTGYGVEFHYLDESSRSEILRLIQREREIPFIPKA